MQVRTKKSIQNLSTLIFLPPKKCIVLHWWFRNRADEQLRFLVYLTLPFRIGFTTISGGADRISKTIIDLPANCWGRPESESPQPPDAPVGAASRSLGTLYSCVTFVILCQDMMMRCKGIMEEWKRNFEHVLITNRDVLVVLRMLWEGSSQRVVMFSEQEKSINNTTHAHRHPCTKTMFFPNLHAQSPTK